MNPASGTLVAEIVVFLRASVSPCLRGEVFDFPHLSSGYSVDSALRGCFWLRLCRAVVLHPDVG